MKILTLIAHSAQLLTIIEKNHKPADKIASEYFRSKKYIGSKERKFIAETLFTTIRNLILVKSIFNANFQSYQKQLLLSNENFKSNYEHYFLLIIQVVLATQFPADFNFYKPFELYRNLVLNPNSTNLLDEIINESAEIKILDKEIIQIICDYYKTLNTTIHNENNYENYIKFVAEKYSFPLDFLTLFLKNQKTKLSNENILEFAAEFNKPAPTCIRINLLNSTVASIINNLNENNIECEKGNLSNSCLIIKKRHQLTDLQIYKNGGIEIQDEASQLVGFCANPKQNDVILDACAGAGGKSLHLSDLQNNKGKIIATDVEFMRLKEIPKRAARCGFSSIETAICGQNGKISLLKNKKVISTQFDIVLVDAPCTGSGTIRRNPIKKYSITEKIINKIAEKQFEILSMYSKFVKEGGFLVYSTCSIFPQENEFVLEKFLNVNLDFVPEPISKHLEQHNVNIANLNKDDYYLTLYPFLHQTDGFFISKLKKQQKNV